MKKLLMLLCIGFTMASCEKEKRDCPSAVEKTFNLIGFNKITAAENFSVHVVRGTAYSIKAKGCADDLSDLALTTGQTGGFLEIKYNHYRNDRYKVDIEITMPALNSLNLAGSATGTVSGFGGQTSSLRTILGGTAQCNIDGLPVRLEAANSGASVLNITGNTNEISGSFSGDARLNGYGAAAPMADLLTSGTAKAYVVAQQKLIAKATGASRIYYKGDPNDKQIEETGNGRVIHE